MFRFKLNLAPNHLTIFPIQPPGKKANKNARQYKVGERINCWEILGETTPIMYPSGRKVRQLACRCTVCNKTIKAVRPDSVNSFKGKSCGCLVSELCRHANTKHGFRQTPLKNIQRNMLDRCNNPKNRLYKNYGGRGIRVCKEWHDLGNFGRWAMENGYEKGLQLDRKDNDKGYSPSNCRFVTRTVNMNNTSRTIRIEYRGEHYGFHQFWEKFRKHNIGYGVALHRLRYLKLSPMDAVTKPRYYNTLQ